MENGKLFYSIGEVAEMLGENASLLRYWESEFPALRPAKNKKGTRSYTQKDIELLRRIHYLTKDCGLTLEGARQQLKNGNAADQKLILKETLMEMKFFLKEIKQNL